MRFKTLAAAAAVALIGSTVMAFATEDTGTITKIEWSTGTITLDNGNTYVVPGNIQENFGLTLGTKVKVTYQDKIVSAIAKSS